MDPLSLRNTSPPASLESPEERRDSMEDADCSPTRFKRPRLDSGSRAVREMSQDLDQPVTGSMTHPATNAPATPTEQLEQTDDTAFHTPKTPSRVTLNLRPSQTPSHTRRATSPTVHPLATANQAAESMDADPDSDSSETLRSSPSASLCKSRAHTPPADAERTDSALSPGLLSSPRVELAVDASNNMEDSSDNVVELNDEDGEQELVQEIAFTDDIFESFPYAKNVGRETALGGMLNLIAKPRNAHPLDGELTHLKDWLKSLSVLVRQGKVDARTTYLQEPVFWDEIAKMFHRIAHRQIPYGEAFELDPGQGEEDALRDLWSAYAECVAQMLKIEIESLEDGSHPFRSSRFVSLNHVKILSQLLRFRDDLPFWALMIDLVGRRVEGLRRVCSSIMSAFSVELDGLASLISLVPLALTERDLRPAAEECLGLLYCLSSFAIQWKEDADRADSHWMAYTLLSLFEKLNQEIQASLKAPIELCTELVKTNAMLLYAAAYIDTEVASQLGKSIYGNSRDIHPSALTEEVLQTSWMLKTLKQYILKGNMAHRIYGVETMSHQFIQVWTTWSQKTHSPEILDHFAQILLEDQIIDYIIGVDSHPQLVSRSGNIVGFLAVTDHYGELQTNAIWDAITESQDPRMAEALIEMLQHTAQLMSVKDLLYLCTKFHTLPLSRITSTFVEFFRNLCSSIQKRARSDAGKWTQEADRLKAFALCVHLAQETYPNPEDSLAPLLQSLHRVAIAELGLFSRGEFALAEDRLRIYKTCASGIAEKRPQAAANAEIIFTMLSAVPDDANVVLKYGVAEHVAEELCFFVIARKGNAMKYLETSLTSRLQLLFHLLNIDPTSITTETQELVWNHLVGYNAISMELRDVAWHHLSAMAKSQSSANTFLVLCATELLPNLNPEFYSGGLFDFLRELTDYQRRTSTKGEVSAEGIFEPPSVELFWRIILTAPSGTIEETTAEYLADLYLDPRTFNRYIGDYPDLVRDTHTALVSRCINQMVTAYSALRNDSASADVDMSGVSMLELQFQRMLLFLMVLLSSVKKRPELQITSPRLAKTAVPARLEDTVGVQRPVKFQAFGTQVEPIKTVYIGDLQTLSWLVERLREWTGFDEVRLIHGGSPLDLQALGDQTIHDLSLYEKGAILVKNIGKSTAPYYGQGSSSVIEKEILANYDTIFNFLDGGDDCLSAAAYDFLNQIPPHGKAFDVTYGGRQTDSIPDIVKSAFTPGKLFKARISVSTLRKDLKNQMRSGPVNVQSLSHSVQLLDAVILDEELIQNTLSGPQDELIARSVLETFTDLLKERVEPEVSASYFADGAGLVGRLMSFLQASLNETPNQELTVHCYSALIEAFNHNRNIWEAFKSRDDLIELHYTLLVSHECVQLREYLSSKIENQCRHSSEKSAVNNDDLVSFYWNILSSLLPRASQTPRSCQQLFDLSTKVFRWYDECSRDEAALRNYITTWSDFLLAHKYDTCVGRSEVDFVVSGFAQLLRTAVQSLKSFKKPLNFDALAAKIFTAFLFPQPSSPKDKNIVGTSTVLPVLDTTTRTMLYDLITSLCEDSVVYKQIIDLNRQLLESCPHDYDEDYVLSGSRDLRSETGYVGLENPQALCYMNSMMTQLFMDIEFRKFVFEAESGTDEGLLKAMQELFATMQSSYGRSVDMKPFANCVRGTDKRPINVAIQMDTEEFFRLLMDQLESELLSPEDKQRLRNFYGGRSVNQIKSKDCQHVSETTETLFNLPLEVKGKETLEDSLSSYVEGESLEGENKYKCEPCGGRLVNAVKRTCLQSVPDNLIIHLKRFDFDPFTMTRSKINDSFRFPSRIDMSPYKVEYLSDPEKPIEEDFFELVGVLVHAGGVEQGHYWSYIRVRPDNQGSSRWIKFNDDTVTEQDLSKVESECYGGNGRHTSAYMLLYQRASSMDKEGVNVLRAPQSLNPIAKMPKDLEESVAASNERHIRAYCMFDKAHSVFIRRMIPQIRTINKGVCTDDHALERRVIDLSLQHAYEVAGRGQDMEDLSNILGELKRMIYPCTECTKLALDWISGHDQALSDWFIFSHQADGGNPVGFQIGCFMVESLKELRNRDPSKYGLDGNQQDLEQAFEDGSDGALHNILARMKTMVSALYHCPRGLEATQRVWDMYFKFLQAVLEFGLPEVALLLDSDFLRTCLEIYHVDSVQEVAQLYPQLRQTLVRKSCRPSFVEMTVFASRLLSYIDLEADLVPTTIERIRSFSDSEILKFPFTHSERNLFYRWDKDNNCLTVLNRLLETWESAPNRPFAPGDIIKLMMAVEPTAGHLRAIHVTIHEGVELLMPHISAPFVMGALYYCSVAPKPKDAVMMVQDIVNCMVLEKQLLGDTFCTFISNLVGIRNEHWGQKYPDFFYVQVVDHAHLWAVRLMCFDDSDVQQQVLTLTRKLITENMPNRGCVRRDFDTDAGLNARIRAVQDLIRHGYERLLSIQKDSDVSKNFIEPLCTLLHDCHRYIRALHGVYPQVLSEHELQDLVQRCLSMERIFREWPESDEYDSTFSGDEELEYTDNDVEAV
ncbi:Peptidase C19 ubiquitin carboxyl-terminal hydrolase 2 [Macrophomina phaseolina MS6]|uniref:Peptidase C19 ubiquitin carboxyl-terminal hydrolase 2 n=1 Tax=Macrophomina phaseolina (strain MS6) TaxID=1126212 RepID=K2R8Y5_MACPH|nr:Peptidase C19 ubiquitin carboxyl-terminal hydrolase 2 [Macrophomina phaseolina MS6]